LVIKNYYHLFFFLFSFFSINKMFDGKFIATILAILVSVFAICNFNTKKITSNEGFGMNPSGSYKIDRITTDNNGNRYSTPASYQAWANPNYQSVPPPRFANVNFGSNIRYNMPKEDYQGTPCEPLTFGNMARENFESNRYTTPTCGKGGASGIPENYKNGNYKQITDEIAYPNVSELVPVGDMSTVNSLGETVQPIIYDRFIYANRNSRLRSQGDPIRGDLPIVPCRTEWFRPSVTPFLDLQQGAMNVMGGVDNSTANAMADLLYNTAYSTISGGVEMAGMKNLSTGQYMNTVQVNGFM
jgi:hypothetical protein